MRYHLTFLFFALLAGMFQTGKKLDFTGPLFEIDGKIMDCELLNIQKIGEPVKLNTGVTEYVVQGAFRQMPDLFLRITFRKTICSQECFY